MILKYKISVLLFNKMVFYLMKEYKYGLFGYSKRLKLFYFLSFPTLSDEPNKRDNFDENGV